MMLGAVSSPLTDAIASAYLTRTLDEGLHSIAHQRVAELSACRCLEHDGMRPGTAEVLARNVGVGSPVASAVGQWIDSTTHNAILSDRLYGRIGCAERSEAGEHWFACVLAAGPLPAQPAAGGSTVQSVAGGPAVFVLPDTAMSNADRRISARSRFTPI